MTCFSDIDELGMASAILIRGSRSKPTSDCSEVLVSWYKHDGRGTGLGPIEGGWCHVSVCNIQLSKSHVLVGFEIFTWRYLMLTVNAVMHERDLRASNGSSPAEEPFLLFSPIG